MPERFWEIDFLRGISLLLMIMFHVAFDAEFMSIASFPDGWKILALPIASSFIFLAGISISLSMARRKHFFRYSIKRGLLILSLGIAITTITYLAIGRGFILFGILHFLGVAILLSYPMKKANLFNPVAAIAAILLGICLMNVSGPDFLAPIGIYSPYFESLDYFPVFPWIGIFISGAWLGEIIYPKGKRLFQSKEHGNRIEKFLCLVGRNSLMIYLIHQPIIIFLILAVKSFS